jgi:hypothetical protein
MTESTSPPPALGEPGSGYQFSYNYANKYFRELLVAKECQLLIKKDQSSSLQVVGDDGLLTTNFKNLSAKLTAEGLR